MALKILVMKYVLPKDAESDDDNREDGNYVDDDADDLDDDDDDDDDNVRCSHSLLRHPVVHCQNNPKTQQLFLQQNSQEHVANAKHEKQAKSLLCFWSSYIQRSSNNQPFGYFGNTHVLNISTICSVHVRMCKYIFSSSVGSIDWLF